MGTQDRDERPGPVMVRAGQIVTAGCFWGRLLDEAETGQGNVITDLSDTVYLTPRAADLIVYVSECFRLDGRHFGIIATGPAKGTIEAAALPGAMDIAPSPGELAGLWRTR